MKVSFDTNVLVSAVATRGLCADLLNVVLAEHELILGETVLAELRRVLRGKFRVPAGVVEEYDALLRQEGHVAGKAQILVTGDLDLLGAASGLPIEILSPRGLWNRLRLSP